MGFFSGSGISLIWVADSFRVSDDNAAPAALAKALALAAGELSAAEIRQMSLGSHSTEITGVDGIKHPSGSGSTSSTLVWVATRTFGLKRSLTQWYNSEFPFFSASRSTTGSIQLLFAYRNAPFPQRLRNGSIIPTVIRGAQSPSQRCFQRRTL